MRCRFIRPSVASGRPTSRLSVFVLRNTRCVLHSDISSFETLCPGERPRTRHNGESTAERLGSRQGTQYTLMKLLKYASRDLTNAVNTNKLLYTTNPPFCVSSKSHFLLSQNIPTRPQWKSALAASSAPYEAHRTCLSCILT